MTGSFYPRLGLSESLLGVSGQRGRFDPLRIHQCSDSQQITEWQCSPASAPSWPAFARAIGEAACDLVTKRNAWLNPPNASEAELKRRTLTNLYNARPAWLVDAHRKLDEAVFAAYGWPSTLTDSEILERLLALNHQRAVRSTKSV